MCFRARIDNSQAWQKDSGREELCRLEETALVCGTCSFKPEPHDKAGEALCSILHQLELSNWLYHHTRYRKWEKREEKAEASRFAPECETTKPHPG